MTSTCVGITDPSRKWRLILSRGALSRSSSPLLDTESPWEEEERTWACSTADAPFHHFVLGSFNGIKPVYKPYRVVVIPQTLWEITIHIINSRF